jgi:hypothetical protein
VLAIRGSGCKVAVAALVKVLQGFCQQIRT